MDYLPRILFLSATFFLKYLLHQRGHVYPIQMPVYQKLFDMDGVKLTFTEGAMEAVAELALARNTGARGLRAIMENLMLSTMYEIPARKDVCEVQITPASVRGEEKPRYVLLRDTVDTEE